MMFATRKSVEMTVLRENQEPAHVVAIFRNAHFYYEGNVEQDYLLPLTPEEAVHYDKLLAAGSHEGFTVSEDGRVKAMLLRLQDENLPVDEAYRKIFAEYLAQKLNKVLKFAEEDGSPSYIHALIALRLINADNKKKVQKKLIEEDDSAAVAGCLAGTTLAQISEYLDLSIKAQAADCTALLLEYKNKHFGGLDPMDSFSLED